MRYIPLRKAVEITGLHPHTLRKYADDGTIPCKRTPFGQRLFNIDAWAGVTATTVCYARVSSHKQKDDLKRQCEWLRERYPEAEIVTDIGSGLNFKRRGLRSLLERSLSGEQLTIVVAHGDRLARFGVELIRWVLERNGGRVVVLGKSAKGSPAEELTQDLLAILAVFSARNNGLRKYAKQIKEDPAVSNAESSGDDAIVDGG
jgi:predicted site-specific integrase-resolvase